MESVPHWDLRGVREQPRRPPVRTSSWTSSGPRTTTAVMAPSPRSSSIKVEEASFTTSIQVGEVEVEEEAPGFRNLNPMEEEASSSEIVPPPSYLPDGKEGFRLPRGWPADFRGSDEVHRISPPCSRTENLPPPRTPAPPLASRTSKSGAGPSTSPDCWGRTAMTLDPPAS